MPQREPSIAEQIAWLEREIQMWRSYRPITQNTIRLQHLNAILATLTKLKTDQDRIVYEWRSSDAE